MSNTNDFETGYQDDNTLGQPSAGTANGSTGFGTSPGAKGAKKKGSKLPLIIFGVVALVAIGGAGFVFLGGSKAPQKPKKDRPAASAPANPADAEKPADTAAADPLATPPASTQAAVDPITGLPVTDPAAAPAAPAPASPALDPITGLPVTDPAAAPAATPTIDPVTGLPVTGTGVAPTSVPAAVDPLADPAVSAATGTPVVAPTIDPVTGLPVTDPATVSAPTPVVPAPTTATAPALPAGTDPLSAFRDMLAPIDGRVTVLEGRVNTLESSVSDISRKVDRLLDRPASTNIITSRPATSRAPARKASAKPRASTPRASNNYVRPAAGPVQPPVSRVVIVSSSSGATVRDADAAPVRETTVAAAPSCSLQAIVPGRVWVKNADGSFASYGEGDRWNGQSVGKIDPARGVQVDGRWICN